MLTQELTRFGLNDKEADVYISTLQLGYASAQEIAAKSGINRTTAYTHIKNLISRGLINAVERMGKIYYVAENPNKLQQLHEQQEKEVLRKKELLDQLMPELESIYNIAKDKPAVKFFNFANQEDLNEMRSEIQYLRAQNIYNLFNYEEQKDYINKQHLNNLLESVERFKAIYIAKNKILDRKLHHFKEHEKFFIKYLPVDRFGLLCEILIADHSVLISREKDALLIKDQLFSQTLVLLFRALWDLAEDI